MGAGHNNQSDNRLTQFYLGKWCWRQKAEVKWEDALPISGFTVDEERIRPSVRYLCWLASGRATGRNIVSYYPAPPQKKKKIKGQPRFTWKMAVKDMYASWSWCWMLAFPMHHRSEWSLTKLQHVMIELRHMAATTICLLFDFSATHIRRDATSNVQRLEFEL